MRARGEISRDAFCVSLTPNPRRYHADRRVRTRTVKKKKNLKIRHIVITNYRFVKLCVRCIPTRRGVL